MPPPPRGSTRRFRDTEPRIRCIILQPDASFMGSEVGAHGNGHPPFHLRDTLADEDLAVSTEDSYRLVKRIAPKRHCSAPSSCRRPSPVCFVVAANLPRDHTPS